MRSGAQTLTLLASPITVAVLQALGEEPRQQTELRRAAGSPAQSTLRAQLRSLCETGTIEKRRRNAFPGTVEHELTASGRDLLAVAELLEAWLQRAPEGPIALGSAKAKAAIKALAESWSTGILRLLAGKALTLTELDRAIASLNYPSLERRLSAMRLAGQVERVSGNGRGAPYEVSRWARESVGPLAAASQWERRQRADRTSPVGKLEVEGLFLLALPLVRLPGEVTGSCRLSVEVTDGEQDGLAGVLATIEGGRTASCTTRLDGNPGAWVCGSTSAWLAALLERDADRLESGGDCRLARSLIDALHDLASGRIAPAKQAERTSSA